MASSSGHAAEAAAASGKRQGNGQGKSTHSKKKAKNTPSQVWFDHESQTFVAMFGGTHPVTCAIDNPDDFMRDTDVLRQLRDAKPIRLDFSPSAWWNYHAGHSFSCILHNGYAGTHSRLYVNFFNEDDSEDPVFYLMGLDELRDSLGNGPAKAISTAAIHNPCTIVEFTRVPDGSFGLTDTRASAHLSTAASEPGLVYCPSGNGEKQAASVVPSICCNTERKSDTVMEMDDVVIRDGWCALVAIAKLLRWKFSFFRNMQQQIHERMRKRTDRPVNERSGKYVGVQDMCEIMLSVERKHNVGNCTYRLMKIKVTNTSKLRLLDAMKSPALLKCPPKIDGFILIQPLYASGHRAHILGWDVGEKVFVDSGQPGRRPYQDLAIALAQMQVKDVVRAWKLSPPDCD